jgi:hypothetical protein
MQGYWISRPVAAEELSRFAANFSAGQP